MIEDDTIARAVETVLPRRLGELQRLTGLPVVFGGAARSAQYGPLLTISHLRGTLSDSLRLLSVISGRGLGGAAMARMTPCRVHDYASTSGITHDYDHVVVEHERLTSILAYPLLVHGTVRGVMYGAVRDDGRIGDTALRNADAVASTISRDVVSLLDRPAPAPPPGPSDSASYTSALGELADIARTTADPALRAALARIHRRLSGRTGTPRPGADAPSLAPRELEALRLVAVGSTNAEIAARLGITVDTVKAYLHTTMRKLDVRNRTRAVVVAREAGIL
ncbi:helix-turn-helix transcriptional regulator [Pseudonocardia endophytica]|uniref:Regulatory LuxR family protein n=1 Tax=Pseudonocardia endophytica TaxID=401976 RepID=A0A4R1HWA2_PSEEN|nr:LuxR C-terminal-related transcriptional regulator [Pseudonocardia endophytica]TCK25731.1 regulatory LuxR family protein [Pseudonocardia endophytica]